MSLGTRGVFDPVRAGRCLAVWGLGTSLLVAVAGGTRPAATPVLNGTWTALPLDRALAGLAALVLWGSLAWGWLALTVTVAEALRTVATGALDGEGPGRLGLGGALRLPGPVRRMVLAWCGVALAVGIAAPALARDASRHPPPGLGSGLAMLVGLPLPDRAVEPPSARRATGADARRAVVVRPGDCLWSIAARDLPAQAADHEIASRWHQIYATNRALIGPDPDLLEPGLRLLLPREEPS